MDVRFHTLNEWPAKATSVNARKSPYQFKADFNTTLADLETELSALGARDIVIQVAADPADIRMDGWLRANARVGHPGVILSFESRHGPLRYLTDRYELWQHNLRAIALGLRALRAVDRYGITERGEQYTGWKALPQTSSTAEPLDLLRREADVVGPADPKSLYRKALHAAHPDHGGSAERFAAVQEAGRKLGVAS